MSTLKAAKREVEVVVISDVHLGTYGCQAKSLLKYLKSVQPKILVLNGDIVDAWQFSKSYWPKSHMRVVKQIVSLMTNGTEVYYVTGNHDDMMRKFVGMSMGMFHVVNKVMLDLDGKRAWIFHGDVFDVGMQHSKWLAKMGANGYAVLLFINKIANLVCRMLGRGPISLARRIKTAVKAKSHFETTAAEIAIEKGYDYVVCGHIHRPEIKALSNEEGSVLYLNSGDWLDNLTALEYDNKKWTLYRYENDPLAPGIRLDEMPREPWSSEQLFKSMLKEFELI